jgi:hypothetical protein
MIRPRYSQADRPARLSAKFVHEVAREVLRMQREVYPAGTDPRGKGHQWAQAPWGGVQKGVVTTAITAASGLVFGQGACQVCYLLTPDATTTTQDPDAINHKVFNWYTNSGTVAVGTHIYVFAADSALWLLGLDC